MITPRFGSVRPKRGAAICHPPDPAVNFSRFDRKRVRCQALRSRHLGRLGSNLLVESVSMVVLPDVVVPADTFKAGRTDKACEDQIAKLSAGGRNRTKTVALTIISKSSHNKPGRSDLDESIRTRDQRRILGSVLRSGLGWRAAHRLQRRGKP